MEKNDVKTAGDPHKPLREQLVLDPLHHLPLSPDCLQVRTASSSTWSWSLVMVMVVLWVTVVDFLLLEDSNGPSFSLGCYNLHVNLKRQCLKSSTCRVMDVFLSEGIEVFPSPTLQPPSSCEIFKKISKFTCHTWALLLLQSLSSN